MRYIANSNGYIKEISFGALISCGGANCTEYAGAVPSGYTSLEDWFNQECEKLYRWRIVDGNLTIDSSAVVPKQCFPVSMALLWGNTSPDSSFDERTISLDLSGYDAVEVRYKCDPAEWFVGHEIVTKVYVGTTGYANWIMQVGLTSDYIAIAERQTTVTENGITFSDCYWKYTNAKAVTTQNTRLIPYKIYGIKSDPNAIKTDNAAICGMFLCGEAVCGQ